MTLSKVRLTRPESERFRFITSSLSSSGIVTVCEQALCPNIGECWGEEGTATFMLLGDRCTRGCRFCYVLKSREPLPPDPQEPKKIANAVKEMGLDYVTLTTVDRDDLPDMGAGHMAETVREIKSLSPEVKVELLGPDFKGDIGLAQEVVDSGLDVFAHNIETVERLTPLVRDARASYWTSVNLLAGVRAKVKKSSILLGFGETIDEVHRAMEDLVSAGVTVVVLSQYMRPSQKQLPVVKRYTEEEFERLREKAYALGFRSVVASPLARTSYRAKEAYRRALTGGA